MKKKEITIRNSAAEYLTFVAATGENPARVELRYEDENVWLTQRMMTELYGVEVHTINEHIKKIYADNELSEEATIRNFRIVQTEGSREESVALKIAFWGLSSAFSFNFSSISSSDSPDSRSILISRSGAMKTLSLSNISIMF